MLVHDMDFQEMARQQMMEGSGKMRAHGGSQVVRLIAGSQAPARPFLQGDIISDRNWLCPSLHNGGARMNNGVGSVKIVSGVSEPIQPCNVQYRSALSEHEDRHGQGVQLRHLINHMPSADLAEWRSCLHSNLLEWKITMTTIC